MASDPMITRPWLLPELMSIQNTNYKYCKISNSGLCTLNSYFCLKGEAVGVEETWQRIISCYCQAEFSAPKFYCFASHYSSGYIFFTLPPFFFFLAMYKDSLVENNPAHLHLPCGSLVKYGTINLQTIILVWKYVCWDFQVYDPLNSTLVKLQNLLWSWWVFLIIDRY